MADPRNNADDAFAAFMSMGDSEWQGLLNSLASGGILQPEEDKGFKRALTERGGRPKGSIPDYSAEAVEPNLDALKRLGQLAAKQGMLELEIEDLEEKLKELRKEHSEYADKLVPALMQEIGMDRVRTKGGLDVELVEHIRASVPQDNDKRERAFSYLHETGNDGIIKREITVRYGREDGKFADDLLAAMKDMGVADHGTIEHEWTIHNSTLVAFLKNELKEGKNVPMEAFGAFIQRQAKLRRR
jgi:hypothetical protein